MKRNKRSEIRFFLSDSFFCGINLRLPNCIHLRHAYELRNKKNPTRNSFYIYFRDKNCSTKKNMRSFFMLYIGKNEYTQFIWNINKKFRIILKKQTR